MPGPVHRRRFKESASTKVLLISRTRTFPCREADPKIPGVVWNIRLRSPALAISHTRRRLTLWLAAATKRCFREAEHYASRLARTTVDRKPNLLCRLSRGRPGWRPRVIRLSSGSLCPPTLGQLCRRRDRVMPFISQFISGYRDS